MTEQNKYSVGNGEKEILGVLIHELGHRYGTRDHYHEGGVPEIHEQNPTPCANYPYCHYCGVPPYKRKERCVMSEYENYNNSVATNGQVLFCTECKNEIIVHLNSHH